MAAVDNDEYDTVVLSGPRSLGKTWIAAETLIRCLTPGDPLNVPGHEYILGAATLATARLTYQFVRLALEPLGGYRFVDTSTRLGITHIPTNTRLRGISSNAKGSFGLVNVPLAVIDEPGALEIVGGQMLADSLFTAQGKVGSKLKLVLIGTLGPMATYPEHWFYQLVDDGSKGSIYVQSYRGDPTKWDKWAEIRRCNPLVGIDAGFRKKLLAERDAARTDSRLRARFLTYRMNCPTADESLQLVTDDEWARTLARPVGDRTGSPMVALDIGKNRSWSAATAIYPSGLIEAVAITPGYPSISDQEKRDRVSAGVYQRLIDNGKLTVADGLRVVPVEQLVDRVRGEWGMPARVICDRFQFDTLHDVSRGMRLQPRISQWSYSTADIRALRRGCSDGPFSVDRDSRTLLTASLRVAAIENDQSGNSRMIKKTNGNTSRDDVAYALHLCAGGWDREMNRPVREIQSLGFAG